VDLKFALKKGEDFKKVNGLATKKLNVHMEKKMARMRTHENL